MEKKKVKWSCKQCGACCKLIIIPLTGLTDDKIMWFNAHRNMKVREGHLFIKSKCKHLGFKNGKHYCKIYEYRPEMCAKAGERQCLRGRTW